MANLCSTSYILVGDKDKVNELRSVLQKLKDTKRTRVSLEPRWIGYIVQDVLGKDWRDIYCRGEWDFSSKDVKEGELHFYTDTAWNACNEVFQKLAEKFGLEMYYVTEELGFNIYETNDSTHTYFPDEIIVTSDEETEYINGRKEVMDYANRHLGTDFNDWDTMLSDEKVDEVFCIHEMEVVD